MLMSAYSAEVYCTQKLQSNKSIYKGFKDALVFRLKVTRLLFYVHESILNITKYTVSKHYIVWKGNIVKICIDLA